jgi:hypothetical protein
MIYRACYMTDLYLTTERGNTLRYVQCEVCATAAPPPLAYIIRVVMRCF